MSSLINTLFRCVALVAVLLLSACGEEEEYNAGACEFHTDYGDHKVYGCHDESRSHCDITAQVYSIVHFHEDTSCSAIGYSISTPYDYFYAVPEGTAPSRRGYFADHLDGSGGGSTGGGDTTDQQDPGTDDPYTEDPYSEPAPACETNNTATITFWVSNQASVSSVTVNLQGHGSRTTTYWLSSPPTCGSTGIGTMTFSDIPAGTYSFSAQDQGGYSWSSGGSLMPCQCTTFELR